MGYEAGGLEFTLENSFFCGIPKPNTSPR